jgi:hypothetical protein
MTALSDWQNRLLENDREELLALLRIRFGDIPPEVASDIRRIDRLDTLQRLFLIAANAADWRVFLEELQAGEESFRLVGERFSPLNLRERDETRE